jgi:hypothetical protein
VDFAQLTRWYFALLVPTVAFKWFYVRGIVLAAGANQSWVEVALGTEGGLLRRAGRVFLALRPDLIEVALVVAAFYVVGALVLRIRVRYLVAPSLALCFLLGAANSLSVRMVGSLMTRNVLSISWDWAREHPSVVTAVLTPGKLAFLSLAALFCYGATLFARPVPTGSRPGRFSRIAPLVALLLLAGTLLTPGPIVPRLQTAANDPTGRPHLSGYWSQTAISLVGREPQVPRRIVPPSAKRLAEEYWTLVYPGGRPPEHDYLVEIPRERVRPRHIVIVALETAPAKYYPLADRPDLPVFHALAQRSMVGTAHYGNAPNTAAAVYTILAGAYFQSRDAPSSNRGPFASDALPAILGRHGYERTYIESYKIDFKRHPNHRKKIKNMGFTQLLETARQSDNNEFEDGAAAERVAFDSALRAIVDADQRGTKAFVFVMSAIGHFPWRAKPEDSGRSGAEKLLGLARFLDELMGSFLASLDAKGLRDDVILVVTGDHGLRFGSEFESLGEPMRVGDAAFHVPLIIYAPGLFEAQVPVPYATFHVDLMPTLLGLLGIPTDGLTLHGENMLDRSMAHRVSFFLNRGISPVSGFYWDGRYFTVDSQTAQVSARPAGVAPEGPPPRRSDGQPWTDQDTRSMIESAYAMVDTTAAWFLGPVAPR